MHVVTWINLEEEWSLLAGRQRNPNGGASSVRALCCRNKSTISAKHAYNKLYCVTAGGCCSTKCGPCVAKLTLLTGPDAADRTDLFFLLSADLISSGLGSPEILPSVLEHGTAAGHVRSPLEQEDEAFVLLPTPRGMKTYCIIQRTRYVKFTSWAASRRRCRRQRRQRRLRCFFFFCWDNRREKADRPHHILPFSSTNVIPAAMHVYE